MTEGLNVIKNLLSSFLPLFLAIIVPSVSPLYCSAIPRNAMGDGRGEGLIPLETRSERCITLSPCVPVREYRGSAHWARGLTFTVKNLQPVVCRRSFQVAGYRAAADFQPVRLRRRVARRRGTPIRLAVGRRRLERYRVRRSEISQVPDCPVRRVFRTGARACRQRP